MVKLVGTPKRIFKKIYKRYNSNNLINSDELLKLFPNAIYLEQDLTYLHELGLIEIDSEYCYHLTSSGRQYFKLETSDSFEIVIKSIFCPIIVAFFTTLVTMWLSSL